MASSPLEHVQTPPAPLPEGRWRVDPARSTVTFRTRAMLGLMPVRGRFEGFDGSLAVDADGRATGELRIETATIATGIAKRDAHLRTADFFDAEHHPHAHFTLTALTSADGRPVARGTLRIRDRDIPVEAPLELTRPGTDVRLQARFPVDHHTAGLGWAKPGMIHKVVYADLDLHVAADG